MQNEKVFLKLTAKRKKYSVFYNMNDQLIG